MSSMTEIRTKIAAGLERSFAAHGFADADIETLRAGAGVSLRTLYKYFPTREDRMLAALEHRHQRYVATVAKALPADPAAAIGAFFDRIDAWMRAETTHGCLFHAAVAAAPGNARLRAMLTRHKAEAARVLVDAIGDAGKTAEITLLIEGLTQSWPLLGRDAVESAKKLAILALEARESA